MHYIKFLTVNGAGPHSGFAWPLPQNDEPGAWVEVKGDLRPCTRGLHATALETALDWITARAFLLEYDGEPQDADDKVVGRRARLVRELPWNDRSARFFAADCAEHVLPIFERERPGDDRPRKAIETARAFARGEATPEQLEAAWAAARDAARAAAWAAAWATARAAARAAAWDAAWDAELRWQVWQLGRYLFGDLAQEARDEQ